MAKTIYEVRLPEEERDLLTQVIAEGKESERTLIRARVLLILDRNKNARISMPKLAEKLGTSKNTIEKIRCEYVTSGVEAALYRKERRRTRSSEEIAKQIVAITKEDPPRGKKRWSLSMLCEESIRRGIVPTIKRTTMKRIMDKYNPSYADDVRGKNHQA